MIKIFEGKEKDQMLIQSDFDDYGEVLKHLNAFIDYILGVADVASKKGVLDAEKCYKAVEDVVNTTFKNHVVQEEFDFVEVDD